MGGTFALATTVAERVLDAGFLVIVGGLSLLGHPLVPEWLSRGLVILAIVSGVGLAVLLAMPRAWDPLAARLERVPRLTSTVRRLRERWLDRFFEGLASIRHPGRMALFLALTCSLWFLDAVGVVLVARALGVVLSIPSALVVLSALGASSAVPLTPGQVGVFQWVASSVLGSYGVPPEPAVVFAIGLQALNYLVLLAWGTVGVFRLGGPEILRGSLPELAGDQAGGDARHAQKLVGRPDLLLYDCADDQSMRTVGRLIWQQAQRAQHFAVGSSGLEYAPAAPWRASGLIPAARASFPAVSPVKQLLVVSGSASPMTASQIQWASEHGFDCIRAPAEDLCRPHAAAATASDLFQRALASLSAGNSVLVYFHCDDCAVDAARVAAALLASRA